MTSNLLTSTWLSRFLSFNRLIVGFSGGLDSSVLLHALASETSLRKKLLAVHINHGISKNASFWDKHCEQFCLNAKINFLSKSIEFNRTSNIEEAARKARYDFFASLVKTSSCLILAHHCDDQAETVLLQLFRGTGIDGLAAMPEMTSFALGHLARPFLGISRSELEEYSKRNQLTWIEDESNLDIQYSRNFLRQQVMPLLKNKWPQVANNISRCAIHCQEAQANLNDLACIDYPNFSLDNRLFIEPLKQLSSERLPNILRFWLKKNQIKMPSTSTFARLIHEVLLAKGDALPLVSWSGVQIRRYKDYLYLESLGPEQQISCEKPLIRHYVPPSPLARREGENEEAYLAEKDLSPSCVDWQNFPEPLILKDRFLCLHAEKSAVGFVVPKDAKLQLRFREGKERFVWHGQTKQLKKLMQEWEIPPWLRNKIPLLYINDQLAVVHGFAISDLFFSNNASLAWTIVSNTISL